MIIIYIFLGLVLIGGFLWTMVTLIGFWLHLLHITHISRLEWNDDKASQAYGLVTEAGYERDFWVTIVLVSFLILFISFIYSC